MGRKWKMAVVAIMALVCINLALLGHIPSPRPLTHAVGDLARTGYTGVAKSPTPASSSERLHRDIREAEDGDSWAQIKLASRYAHGDGVPPNREQALHWYLQAIEHGNPAPASAAAHGIADMYTSYNDGVRPDDEEAYFWYTVAEKISPNGPIADAYIRLESEIPATKKELINAKVDQWMSTYQNSRYTPPAPVSKK